MKAKMEMTYREISQLAREVEQGGDLGYAASLWLKASALAKRDRNQQWCKHRAAFCERWRGRIEQGATNGN